MSHTQFTKQLIHIYLLLSHSLIHLAYAHTESKARLRTSLILQLQYSIFADFQRWQYHRLRADAYTGARGQRASSSLLHFIKSIYNLAAAARGRYDRVDGTEQWQYGIVFEGFARAECDT